MTTFETVDAAAAFIHHAGYSVTAARIITAHGCPWIVTATDGKRDVRAEGKTHTEAWVAAAEQVAELVEW